jgi:hypothetical protein
VKSVRDNNEREKDDNREKRTCEGVACNSIRINFSTRMINIKIHILYSYHDELMLKEVTIRRNLFVTMMKIYVQPHDLL